MHAIGIDMSKDTFHAAFESLEVEVFANTEAGIHSFMRRLKDFEYKPEETRIGVEATGVYHLLLADRMRMKGWQIVVINPILTSRLTKLSVRRVKTDKKDALRIREGVLLEYGQLYTDTHELLTLKILVQQRQALAKMRSECRQRIHAQIYKQRVLKDELPKTFQIMEKTLSKEIRKLEKQMLTFEPEKQILLRSIPGIGTLAASTLVAFVGDIQRFSSPEKLVAYIGLDCRVHESGTSIHGKGYISKRGNKYLRTILFSCALIAKRYNPDLQTFFQKKILEGKHHFKALCAVERKLIHVVYAVWKRGTPFVK